MCQDKLFYQRFLDAIFIMVARICTSSVLVEGRQSFLFFYISVANRLVIILCVRGHGHSSAVSVLVGCVWWYLGVQLVKHL